MTPAAGFAHLLVWLGVVLAFFGVDAEHLMPLAVGFWLLGPAFLLAEHVARIPWRTP